MDELKDRADEFETVSKSIVKYLLRDTDAEITKTKPKKDGGYDIVVKCQDNCSRKFALFECKLRKGNLNLRDIAANVIIAFNHGAISLIAITNYDFTQQTGEELIDFCQHTVLNIKIIIGEELRQILNDSCIDITKELYDAIDFKKTMRKNEFTALRINLDQNILPQIFPSKRNYNLESNTLIESLFPDKITYISTALLNGGLVAVTGYMGVGKKLIIQEAFGKLNKRIIIIDATLHQTKDLVILDILAQIWGVSSTKIFSFFSKNDIEAIAEVVGKKSNDEETVTLLTALLNEAYADKHTTAQNNVILCNYLISLLTLHIEDIGFVIYIKKMQFATQEIFDFLIYFIKYLARDAIGCVISYDKPEYIVENEKKPLDILRQIDQYDECQIEMLDKEKAVFYIQQMYPQLSNYETGLIIEKVGTRLYNLSHLLKSLFPQESTLPIDSNLIIQRLQFCSPNNVISLISQTLPYYRDTYPELFRICYLFDCQVPIELGIYIDCFEQAIIHMTNIGIFCCDHGVLMADNEFVRAWIMEAYSDNSPSIQMTALKLLNASHTITYNIGYINMYRVLGWNTEALDLLEKNLNILKREKQYSSLRKGLLQAIEISHLSYERTQEIKYLIALLEIITIQKEITSDEAKSYIARLEYYSQCKILSEKDSYALSFFKIKREFKLGTYVQHNNPTIEIGKNYYNHCVDHTLSDNTDDWLGKICSCYALLIKSTKGNKSALKIFENSLKVFPNSFDLRREYFSHIACMQLFDEPLKAYENYQKILTFFKKEAPDSAALPFHEYGDLALSQLIAQILDNALLCANNAIEINQANGLIDEEGRCINIRGCIEWCQGKVLKAEKSFREAITIMKHSQYNHYLWRSQLNMLQLSLITSHYSDDIISMFENVYADFKNLLAPKIHFLAQSDADSLRKTIEYHALIVFGVLQKEMNISQTSFKVYKDFELGQHTELYENDVDAFFNKNYYFSKSPYIQNGYIFFAG